MKYGIIIAAAGYGNRIFVKFADIDKADPILKPRSMWKGDDKRWGDSLGYEFDDHNFNMAIDELKAIGFEQTSINYFN